jgi:hypothetical protein
MSRIAACWAVLVVGMFTQGHAMAFSKTFHLFSEVDGIVLQAGRPVEGVEVAQEYRWHWTDQQARNVTRTDAQGRYHFPAITGQSFSGSLLPHEPVVNQRIQFVHQGKTYQGWYHAKHNYDDRGELGGKPMRLVCDLNDEPVPRPEIGSSGICTLQK